MCVSCQPVFTRASVNVLGCGLGELRPRRTEPVATTNPQIDSEHAECCRDFCTAAGVVDRRAQLGRDGQVRALALCAAVCGACDISRGAVRVAADVSDAW